MQSLEFTVAKSRKLHLARLLSPKPTTDKLLQGCWQLALCTMGSSFAATINKFIYMAKGQYVRILDPLCC